MGFIDAIKTCFTKYADFNGRARRSEYWYFQLFLVIADFVIGLLALIPFIGIIFALASWALVVPSWAVAWRRMHDTGRSGLYALLQLIPLVGLILIIVWACEDSQAGSNEYGPSPKGSYNTNESNIF